ncbi:MAG: GNA1162 family protein [Thermodesulfobacteriota bacterium]
MNTLKKKEGKPIVEGLPRTVAVLPFGNETEEIGISNKVRKSFFNHFSSKPYIKIDPSVVDEKVTILEKKTGKTVFDIPPEELVSAIGCDGLIYGNVIDYKRLFAVAYSQVGIEAEVWLVNAKTGKELWRGKESVRYHTGAVPLSPMDLVMTTVSSALNLRNIQVIRVVNEIGWKLNKELPAPEGIKIEKRPVIKNAVSNAADGPFGKGGIVRVAMDGEPGLVAFFDIGGHKSGVPMKEVAVGSYMGEYPVEPGDNLIEAPVIMFLKRPTGEESRWLDIGGHVTIDTTPPGGVTGLRGRSFIDRLELSWERVPDDDLKGYRVLRSLKKLSDYEEIGLIEEERFVDKGADSGVVYHYRVAAVDRAGNSGALAEPVKLVLREKAPVLLAGEIKEDRTLVPGDYIVRGELIVASSVILNIEPGVKILFEEGASLHVMGSIKAEGTKETGVEFLPATPETTWKGIAVEGDGATFSFARISGAVTALEIIKTPSELKDVVLEGNKTALHTVGLPSPRITSSTIWHNTIGVSLQSSKAVLKANEITQNGTGIRAVASSPTISDNNIYGNEINVEAATHTERESLAGKPEVEGTEEGGAEGDATQAAPSGDSAASLNVDRNYFGTIVHSEMRFKGNVAVKTVLDEKYPDGHSVEVEVDPYARLSPEEKKKKVAELSIAGGRYFKKRNFGKAVENFEELLTIEESPTTYYYLALSYQGMEDNKGALEHLKNGAERFPLDSNLKKAYGLLLYQLGRNDEARTVMREALRLNPSDKQVKFILERLEAK